MRVLLDLRADIENKHVLVVEDIIDTGYTLQYLLLLLNARKPASLSGTCPWSPVSAIQFSRIARCRAKGSAAPNSFRSDSRFPGWSPDKTACDVRSNALRGVFACSASCRDSFQMRPAPWFG